MRESFPSKNYCSKMRRWPQCSGMKFLERLLSGRVRTELRFLSLRLDSGDSFPVLAVLSSSTASPHRSVSHARTRCLVDRASDIVQRSRGAFGIVERSCRPKKVPDPRSGLMSYSVTHPYTHPTSKPPIMRGIDL